MGITNLEEEQLIQALGSVKPEKGIFRRLFYFLKGLITFPRELNEIMREANKEKRFTEKVFREGDRRNKIMGHCFGTTGMWYVNGIFYELEDRHINFFLKYPEILGFTDEEKRELCEKNGLKPDAVFCEELSVARNEILTEVLKRSAIRIRFYKGQTSVQCGSKDNPENLLQLKKCVADGWGKCFGSVVNVMDVYGWNELVSDMGYGTSFGDFCGEKGIFQCNCKNSDAVR